MIDLKEMVALGIIAGVTIALFWLTAVPMIMYLDSLPNILNVATGEPGNIVPVGVCGDRFQTQPCVNPELPVEVYMVSGNFSPEEYTCKYNDACYRENCTDEPNSSWMSCDRCMVECVRNA